MLHFVLPDLMQSRISIAEAVELSLWARESSRRHSLFNKSPDGGAPLRELSQSIANLRNTAVHRVRVHAKELKRSLNDAE